jgi:hypothetical protein
MPGSWPPPPQLFPNLSPQNSNVTSPATKQYNCIAWAAGDDSLWWWPDPLGTCYWPPGVARDVTVGAFLGAYALQGYVVCFGDALEAGFEKVAIFGTKNALGEIVPTHAARQLPSGVWTSKLGDRQDISHSSVHDVAGPVYGTLICCMSRPVQQP